MIFFFNDTATTEIYTLSLHDALPICSCAARWRGSTVQAAADRDHPDRRIGAKSVPTARETRSEEHTSELQSLAYLVCRLLLEKKKMTVLLPLVRLDTCYTCFHQTYWR